MLSTPFCKISPLPDQKNQMADEERNTSSIIIGKAVKNEYMFPLIKFHKIHKHRRNHSILELIFTTNDLNHSNIQSYVYMYIKRLNPFVCFVCF